MGLGDRLGRYRDSARAKLRQAFEEEHTPHQVAASFALGIFVTAMPTGGLGLGLFVVFGRLWPWVSTPALFASAAVLNPFVKSAVYVSSITLGGLVLGTDPVVSYETAAESASVAVRQLLVGNTIIAVGLAVVSYVVIRWLTVAERARQARPTTVSMRAVVLRAFRRK
ncbi:DUF2062 family protein [Natrialba magadii ATCC 43099]|uniref:DUF2062 family protein n=1 Tax=Natrialba magadii (strain ATCC 43099 / DSM 3394 / CCM 3739 / CIP 104546 / IAM 13178 / JCM 8861 / NBRC 102185 / NCIMB 2190 / MS3) TaxID=547559 RepID=D3SX06_NATMM|nr:DUF2062 domain-containing protein [Natrialba magadii]ADD05888.1 DUF2062 family protein [Natrialba magadii ATCC 43099]ELY30604.1 hypothetical protein C500_08792 [Natrialba magadii ATCC 43099]